MSSLTTALTTIRRSPYQALACILMTSITFFVAYAFGIFMFVSTAALDYFETQPQVIAFFELGLEQEKVDAAAKNLEEKDFVGEVKTVSQSQALELYKEENKQDPLLLELVTSDILPASIEVSGKNIKSLEKIKEELEKTDGVEDIVFQEDTISSLQFWIGTTKQVGLITIAIFSGLSLLIIWVVIAMKASAQKKTIAIMRMLGASKWYIKAPFVLEGSLYGGVGAITGWMLSVGTLLYLMPMLEQAFSDMHIFPIAVEIYIISLSIGVAIGAILGSTTSSMVVNRLIKR